MEHWSIGFGYPSLQHSITPVFPWRESMALKNLNKPVPRTERADKASGTTPNAADIPVPAALSAKILRTSVPHARILSIDTSKAAEHPGVRAIISGADVAGVMVGLRMKDMPLLAQERVRYVG